MAKAIQCDSRDEHGGRRTCLQTWRDNLEHVCRPCAIRWDHNNGKHAGDPQSDCPQCKEKS